MKTKDIFAIISLINERSGFSLFLICFKSILFLFYFVNKTVLFFTKIALPLIDITFYSSLHTNISLCYCNYLILILNCFIQTPQGSNNMQLKLRGDASIKQISGCERGWDELWFKPVVPKLFSTRDQLMVIHIFLSLTISKPFIDDCCWQGFLIRNWLQVGCGSVVVYFQTKQRLRTFMKINEITNTMAHF